MKKKIFIFVMACFLILPTLVLFGCGTSTATKWVGPKIDNAIDLVEVDDSEVESPAEEETYYKSKSLQLVTEINGSYRVDRPFTVDENDEYKRVYDDLYLYQYDSFYMGSDKYDMWCTLSDTNDLKYAETAYSEGQAYQIDVKVSGVYKLVFDVVKKSFDLEYKGEITTPVYEEIKACDIFSVEQSWQEMTKSGDEFYINNFHIATGKAVAFFSKSTHTSRYKTTIDAEEENKYLYKSGTKPSSDVYFMIGGTYNIYLNAKTYVVRAELVEADDYTAVVYVNGEFKNLQLLDEDVKHVFTYQYVATSDIGGYGVISDDVPKIFNKSYKAYNLTPSGADALIGKLKSSYYFKKAGTYNLTINLQTFEFSVEKLPE